jgi:hypothetical protein
MGNMPKNEQIKKWVCHSLAQIIAVQMQVPFLSSTPRIDFENMSILRAIKLGQLLKKWNAESFTIPQVIQIGSSIRFMLCRCLCKGQCPVMSPTKILIVWIWAASVSILSWAFSATFLTDGKLFPNSMRRSVIWITTPYIFVWHMRMPKEDKSLTYLLMWHYNQYLVEACPRRQDSGPTKTELDPLPASAAAAPFLWIPQWAKTHSRRILLDRATLKTHLTFVGVNI